MIALIKCQFRTEIKTELIKWSTRRRNDFIRIILLQVHHDKEHIIEYRILQMWDSQKQLILLDHLVDNLYMGLEGLKKNEIFLVCRKDKIKLLTNIISKSHLEQDLARSFILLNLEIIWKKTEIKVKWWEQHLLTILHKRTLYQKLLLLLLENTHG